ncbi:tetratricopeptide repeat protein [Myxococcus sp. SDU36]|uniref:tetratricopeptide repeat protein n=1 Tax=Myxococcus sp. SDU36 TaxID=2831967 RepID=UPI0025429864|nr:tetratricopeptide repeat protein [Myxococcus sp. SDU36]
MPAGCARAEGHLYVAFAYEQGRGVRKNLGRAIQIYKKAADAGNADAQCVLGWMCLNGVGGSTDILGALRWYQQSAEQGNASALFSLGQMYGEGNGVPKSRTRAARYLRLAAALGHSRSADYLKELGFEE